MYDLNDLALNPFDYCVSIKYERSEAIEIIKKNIQSNETSQVYGIEGVVNISYKNKQIIPFTYWDDVDCLWAYLLNCIDEYIDKGSATYYFPGQPIPIYLSKKGQRTLCFSVNEVSIVIDEKQFLFTLTEKAQDFFDFITNVVGQNSFFFERHQIQLIMNKLKDRFS